ncbi:hypothetical protein BJ508DRAFT_307161 [Ascobolus immersus RN42]|uniref:Uncharacterized protein n=1 Tax=Ascobolus immersus RN42 TaxID=1160509 RepID=A0A3N4I3X4_ASCIM|nr:hypothetical protein BJ508DRAFT_307161 [Ascobolus immersus RN42]
MSGPPGSQVVKTCGVYESVQDANNVAKFLLTKFYTGAIDPGFLERWSDPEYGEITYDEAQCLTMNGFPEEAKRHLLRRPIRQLPVPQSANQAPPQPSAAPATTLAQPPAQNHTEQPASINPTPGVPSNTANANKRTIDQVTDPTEVPPAKRPTTTPSSEAPTFKKITIYELITNTTVETGRNCYNEPEENVESESIYFLQKANAIRALHNCVKHGEAYWEDDSDSENGEPDENERLSGYGVRYDKDGLPSHEGEPDMDGEIVDRTVKKKEVEVLFRKRGNKEFKAEVVEKLAVEDWDGTKPQYEFLLGTSAIEVVGGSVECPVVID